MSLQQFISFTVGKNLLGINILYVREINKNLSITPVDRAPHYIKGLLNLRGQIVTILDLSVRLGLEPQEESKQPTCIILKTNHELLRSPIRTHHDIKLPATPVGLLVDSVGDVISCEEDRIKQPCRTGSDLSIRYINGVIELDNSLLVTLNTKEILEPKEIAA